MFLDQTMAKVRELATSIGTELQTVTQAVQDSGASERKQSQAVLSTDRSPNELRQELLQQKLQVIDRVGKKTELLQRTLPLAKIAFPMTLGWLTFLKNGTRLVK